MTMRLPKRTKAATAKHRAKYPTTAARKKYRAAKEHRAYELMLWREAKKVTTLRPSVEVEAPYAVAA